MGESLVKKKINVGEKQKKLILNVIDAIVKREEMEEEEVILVVNKIVMIGEVNALVRHAECRKKIIKKLYGRLIQKHKLLISLIQN